MAYYTRTTTGWKAQVSYKDIKGDFKRKSKSKFRTKADAQAWANELEVKKIMEEL